MSNSPCRCNCGYRCGGPGKCKLDLVACLNTNDGNHFVVDCEHDWTGPWKEWDNGRMGSVTCARCGITQMGHDMRCGP